MVVELHWVVRSDTLQLLLGWLLPWRSLSWPARSLELLMLQSLSHLQAGPVSPCIPISDTVSTSQAPAPT